MAEITATSITGSGQKVVSTTTLGASDTITFNAGKTPLLLITNNTAGAITPNITGDGATTAVIEGIGAVDLSGGFTFDSIADGTTVAIRLNTISKYLDGTITVTAGDGATAQLLEF